MSDKDLKGFFVYANNWRFMIDSATDADLGIAFRAVYKYIIDGVDYTELAENALDAFKIAFIQSVIENILSNKNLSRVRAENGKKGGQAKADNQKTTSYDLDAFKEKSLAEPLIYERKKESSKEKKQ